MIRPFLLAALASSVFVACAAPSGGETDSSQANLSSSSVKLEESRIEVYLDQKNSPVEDAPCSIDSVKFRITYKNPTLPAGATVTLHEGESAGEQEYIGDGFGWTQWSKQTWTQTQDVAMPEAGGTFAAEIPAKPYGKMYQDWSSGIGQWVGMTYPAEIQFVFRVQLPDGTVLWDNRLHQDYWVEGNGTGDGATCGGTSTNGFVFRQGWGPF
jgi:hypothetical protein